MAYKASRVYGLGILQKREDATEDDVWQAAYNQTDYPGGRSPSLAEGQVHADYVFGRMMKLDFRVKGSEIEYDDFRNSPSWQSYAWKYQSNKELFDEAYLEVTVHG